MGREIKRVPVDFDWPIDEVWQGYLMPESLHLAECTECAGSGTTPARQWVEQITRLLVMLEDDLRAQSDGRPMHPYFRNMSNRLRARPSIDIVGFAKGLAGRGPSWLGRDSWDAWRAAEKVIGAAGLDPKVWGTCPVCGGEGTVEKYPGQRVDSDAWDRVEPPTGDGWQAWETVSEGSPISPVFATSDELVEWAVSSAGRLGIGGSPVSRTAAESFVREGWAPSMVALSDAGPLLGGVEALADNGTDGA